MPFVIEAIPEDVITSGVLSRYRTYNNNRLIPFCKRWLVDHDRDARMAIVSRVGGASVPSDGTRETDGFVLSWHEHLIHILADLLGEEFPSSGPEMNWLVHRVQLPNALQARQDEALDLIRDAFRVYGYGFDGHQYAAVNVRFDLSGSGAVSGRERGSSDHQQ